MKKSLKMCIRDRFWFAFIVALIGVITSIAVGIGTREVESKIRDNNEKTSLKQVFKVLGQNDQDVYKRQVQ